MSIIAVVELDYSDKISISKHLVLDLEIVSKIANWKWLSLLGLEQAFVGSVVRI